MLALDQHLTTSQVARRLGVSPDRVLQLAKAGQLPYQRSPHGRLFDPANVERLAAARAQRQPTHAPTAAQR